MCGSRKEWGDKQLKFASTHDLEIVKMPFYSNEAGKYIKTALEKGIGTMPFFTDGKKYSLKLEDFIEKPIKKGKKEGNETNR